MTSSPSPSRFLPPGGSPTTKGFTIRTTALLSHEKPLSQSPIKSDIPWTAESEGVESAATIAVLKNVFGIAENDLNNEEAAQRTYNDAKALLAPDPPKKRATKKNPNPVQPKKYIPERARLEGVSLSTEISMDALSLRDGRFDELMDGDIKLGPMSPRPQLPKSPQNSVSRGSTFSGSNMSRPNQGLESPKQATATEQKQPVSGRAAIVFSESVITAAVPATKEDNNSASVSSTSNQQTEDMAHSQPMLAMISKNPLLKKFIDDSSKGVEHPTSNGNKSNGKGSGKSKSGNIGKTAEAVASGKWIAKKKKEGGGDNPKKRSPPSTKGGTKPSAKSGGKRKVQVTNFGVTQAEVAGAQSEDEDEDALDVPRSEDEGFVVDDEEEAGDESGSSDGGEDDEIDPEADVIEEDEAEAIKEALDNIAEGQEEDGDAMETLRRKHKRENRDKTLKNIQKQLAIEKYKKQQALEQLAPGETIPDSDDSSDDYVASEGEVEEKKQIAAAKELSLKEQTGTKPNAHTGLAAAANGRKRVQPSKMTSDGSIVEREHGKALQAEHHKSADPKSIPTLNPRSQEEVQFGSMLRLVLNSFLNEADSKNGAPDKDPLMRILNIGAQDSEKLTNHERQQFKMYCYYFGDYLMSRQLEVMYGKGSVIPVVKSQAALADRIMSALEHSWLLSPSLSHFVRQGELKFDAHENVFPMDYRCCNEHPLLEGGVDNDAPLSHCILTHELLTAKNGLSVTINVPGKGLHVAGFIRAELGALLNAIQFSLNPGKQLYDSLWNFLLVQGYSPEPKPDGSGRPVVTPQFANVKKREMIRDQYIRTVAPAFWHQYKTFRQTLSDLWVLLFEDNPLSTEAAAVASASAPISGVSSEDAAEAQKSASKSDDTAAPATAVVAAAAAAAEEPLRSPVLNAGPVDAPGELAEVEGQESKDKAASDTAEAEVLVDEQEAGSEPVTATKDYAEGSQQQQQELGPDESNSQDGEAQEAAVTSEHQEQQEDSGAPNNESAEMAETQVPVEEGESTAQPLTEEANPTDAAAQTQADVGELDKMDTENLASHAQEQNPEDQEGVNNAAEDTMNVDATQVPDE